MPLTPKEQLAELNTVVDRVKATYAPVLVRDKAIGEPFMAFHDAVKNRMADLAKDAPGKKPETK